MDNKENLGNKKEVIYSATSAILFLILVFVHTIMYILLRGETVSSGSEWLFSGTFAWFTKSFIPSVIIGIISTTLAVIALYKRFKTKKIKEKSVLKNILTIINAIEVFLAVLIILFILRRLYLKIIYKIIFKL